ncbi:MAG: iron-containing alcohol dehydrogenase [Arenicella sp.]
MQDTIRVCTPRYLQIGKGSITQLSNVLKTIGSANRPLIVTDKMMVELGHVDRIRQHLNEHGINCGVFDETIPDPTDTVIEAGLNTLKSGGFDCVIGLGGGSPIDTAKAISVLSQHSSNILDYRPPKQFNQAGLPIIAIPTTAGTGSEVTHHTVIVHSATQEKISCRGEAFVPTAAIIDYELTLSKPSRLTADNALDTLTHAIEAYVSHKATLYTDRLALDCMRLVTSNLKKAYLDPGDIVARESLMLAATFGGLAFSNSSIALVHAMSRPLGSLFHVPHGMGNAMLLPTVTAFSKPAALSRYADCAKAMGWAKDDDTNDAAANALVNGLYALNDQLNVPTLSAFGIDKTAYDDAIDQMADDAIRSGAPGNNPKASSKEEISHLYKQVWA